MSTETRPQKTVGRWKKGGVRYTDPQRAELAKFSEQPGWRNGARVVKKGA